MARVLLTTLFIIGSLGVAPSTSVAADGEGRYALEGPGRLSCQTLVDIEPASDELKLVAAWTLGYFSAHNRLLADTYDLTPWQNIESVIGLARQYCLSNSEATFEAALQELMRFLGPDRMQASEPLVRIGSGASQSVIYRSTLIAARQKLGSKGYTLPTDEQSLFLTLKEFQKDNTLLETGILDQATLLTLFDD